MENNVNELITGLLKPYIGVKQVGAVPMTKGDYIEYSRLYVGPCSKLSGGDSAEERMRDGYLVSYPQADLGKIPYISWCPKAEFEAANRPTDGMSFGKAIEAAKRGFKIARRKWNGKDMFVVYMPPLQLPPHSSQEPGAKVNDRKAKFIGEDTPLDCQPYFAMFNAQKQWIPGWLASQSDMLDDDWYIVE